MTFKITGVFYTDQEVVFGEAIIDGSTWSILDYKKEEKQAYRLFLDKDRKIEAPKNQEVKEIGEKKVRDLLEKYRKEAESLREDKEALRINGLRMKLVFLDNCIKEYEKIYRDYFMASSIKFILDLV